MLGMCTAGELLQIGVALVVQLFVNADLRRVVTIDCCVLDGAEELLFDGLGRLLVRADLAQQLDLLVRCRVRKRLAEPIAAHLVDCRQTVTPGLFCRIGRFTDYQIDILVDLGRFCTWRTVIRWDDALGHFQNGSVLVFSEEPEWLWLSRSRRLRGMMCMLVCEFLGL